MKVYFYITTGLLFFCFLNGGCNKEDLLDSGTCKIKVEGYLNKSFDGEAVFDDVPGLGGTYFFLVLQNIEKPGEKYKFAQLMSKMKPNAGSYSLNPNDTTQNNIYATYEDSDVEGSFHPVNGMLEINLSNNREIKGRCDFTAETYISLGNGNFQKVQIKVTGEFYAQEGNVGIILGKKNL